MIEQRTTTIWITGDQCSHANSALLDCDQDKTTVLMIESIARARQRPYHKHKLVLIYSVMRHFAAELTELGWHVDYYAERQDFESALSEHIDRYRPTNFRMMHQSEYGVTERMTAALEGLPCTVTPHCQFISSAADFESLHKGEYSRVTMENFYRKMRVKTGLLVDGREPVGGAWNFDKENRNPPGSVHNFEAPLKSPADDTTAAVIDMVNKHFPEHVGVVSRESWHLAVTRRDALAEAADFFDRRLDQFGPYQDAMLSGQVSMNHSMLSAYINTGLLHPLELARDAEQRYLDGTARLSSVEGFIRQLIGWREFIWRIYWRLMPEYRKRNGLKATNRLPAFFWSGDTDMFCLREALTHVREHAYSHHILRLMVLGNFSLLAGLQPEEVNDWFWAMYIDGYDWVMVPNVIGMVLHADGGYVGTKPYAASANYINKMSDYCKKCVYNPKLTTGKGACPFNALYWDFLDRNQDSFKTNHRMQMSYANLRRKSDIEVQKIREQARAYIKAMAAGDRL
ncbi:MAG: cryptochrome/photolyase family protein [Cyanobacteria bacterium REEB67]|nr:cryptochrome/photolyase family protein [Cyanobacteria bacterium REEB67]